MMDSIISYFETIPSLHRTLILMGGLMFFWSLESIVPIITFKYKKWRHALPNLFFTATTAIVNLAFAFLIIRASDAASSAGWGVLTFLQSGTVLSLIVGLLLLDLIGAYLAHWVEHKVHWMWKFHIIHHSDTQVDASTALRHHPGESVIRAVFTLLAVVITGAPMWMVMLYQSSSALLSQFNHANLSIPAWLDRPMGLLIVTPRMHRVHHHETLPYTDANYGNLFSLWDRLFGTYMTLDSSEIVYGLDVFDKREENLSDLLGLPFDGRRYKNED